MSTPFASSGASKQAAGAEVEVDESVSEQVSSEVFATYQCKSIDRGIEHPGDIAEPVSLSAISLPKNDYPLWDSVGDDLIQQGKLSKLQLEGVRYACRKHQEILPTGQRAGFFIGDGAGVGKGRQVSGIILDNYCRGRTRHLWFSTSSDLFHDAQRDLRDMGLHIKVINNCQELDAATKAAGLSKDFQEGVLFLTYSTLVSAGRGGMTRFQQIIKWVGGDAFDGCLVFDECHRAKNFVPGKEAQSTKVAANVRQIQDALPMARVVYCSATGVSEIGNTAYMSRMGLWGQGTAFPDFDTFLDSMKRRGVSFLEMLAMEMKSEGKYVARGLSFKDAEFMHAECKLTSEQIETYNRSVEVWQRMRIELAGALALTGGGADVWRMFWSSQQRFFKLLCVSLKLPTVVAEARAALDSGMSVVIGLQSTGESAADSLGLEPGQPCGFVSAMKELLRRFVLMHFPTRRDSKAKGAAQSRAPEDVEIANEDGKGDTGAAATGAPGEIAQCVQSKQALLHDIDNLPLPANFLDELVDKLGGPSNVSEMTGRRARVVRVGGRGVYQLRAKIDNDDMDSLNVKEKDAFVDGNKLVAIISDAASTGISLHAQRGCGNQRRRVHLTIELPWSADKAIQQLGRSHRSNQTSAPLYKLVTTNVGGESRFAAAVARRLQSLGALTRGDRRAASGIDLSEQNFDSPLGRSSLRRMYDHIVTTSSALPAGVSLAEICHGVDVSDVAVPELGDAAAAIATGVPLERAQAASITHALHRSLQHYVDLMGIGSNIPRGDTVGEDRPSAATLAGASKEMGDVRRFLNRLLGLRVHRQNLFFNYFCATLQAEVRAAKAEGTFSEGVSDMPAAHITAASDPKVLWVDPHSGLHTMQHTLRVDRGVSFAAAKLRLSLESVEGDGSGFYVSRKPWFGRSLVLLAIARPGPGNLFSICRPNTGHSFFDMDRSELHARYVLRDTAAAEADWQALYTSCLESCVHGALCHAGSSCTTGKRITTVTLLTGSIVRIWAVLEQVLKRHEHQLNKADRAMRIIRVSVVDTGSLIGIRYKESLLPEVVATLSTIQSYVSRVAANPAIAAALTGNNTQSLQQRVGELASSAGMVRSQYEAVTPVDARLRAKAFRPPKTLLNFFAPQGCTAVCRASDGNTPCALAKAFKTGTAPHTQRAGSAARLEKRGAADAVSAARAGSGAAMEAGISAAAGAGVDAKPDVLAARPSLCEVVDLCDSQPASRGGEDDTSGRVPVHPAEGACVAAAPMAEILRARLAQAHEMPRASAPAPAPDAVSAEVPGTSSDENSGGVRGTGASDATEQTCGVSRDREPTRNERVLASKSLRGQGGNTDAGAAHGAKRLKAQGGRARCDNPGSVNVAQLACARNGCATNGHTQRDTFGTEPKDAAVVHQQEPERVSDDVKTIMGMGFTQHNAAVALKVTRGNLERAINYLLSGS